MPTQAEKAARFVELHRRDDVFVIPNPWDAASARVLTHLGFEALATTSSGFALQLGAADGARAVDRATMLENCREICAATPLPVNGDLENCYADDPREAATTIPLAAEAGLVGCSIEDYSCNPSVGIYGFEHSVERVQAAVEAARALPFPFVLTARAENLIRNVKDLDDTIRRLKAYEAAGADVLYAPGIADVEMLRTVLAEITKPFNLLIGSGNAQLTVADARAAGVRRISVGGALARAAASGFLAAAREIAELGTFRYGASLLGGAALAPYRGG
ncbi:MAG: isocitrate lyase/phosphoenolpyruvate mutase family protein [Ectothiorhodospiraceae bacterium]|nr:isocitrate lyase/phosphoenolpyruvate mutase family protein [Ectothiorhodospiraceae bacterium]